MAANAETPTHQYQPWLFLGAGLQTPLIYFSEWLHKPWPDSEEPNETVQLILKHLVLNVLLPNNLAHITVLPAVWFLSQIRKAKPQDRYSVFCRMLRNLRVMFPQPFPAFNRDLSPEILFSPVAYMNRDITIFEFAKLLDTYSEELLLDVIVDVPLVTAICNMEGASVVYASYTYDPPPYLAHPRPNPNRDLWRTAVLASYDEWIHKTSKRDLEAQQKLSDFAGEGFQRRLQQDIVECERCIEEAHDTIARARGQVVTPAED